MPKMNTETLKFFESLTQAHALQVAELQKVIDTQSESIRDMQETISRLEETVRILTEKLNKSNILLWRSKGINGYIENT